MDAAAISVDDRPAPAKLSTCTAATIATVISEAGNLSTRMGPLKKVTARVDKQTKVGRGMTLDDIIAALKATDAPPPAAALNAAVTHADELAPVISVLSKKLRNGISLLPSGSVLLFHGLNVLAAARHPGLLDELLALARQTTDDLEQIWPLHVSVCLQRLILSVWDPSATDLFRSIELGDHEAEAKWALFNVLARLTSEGRIARDETLEFLARIERDGLIDDGDSAWWGWAEAVERLGLTELEPALRRVWAKPIFEHHDAEELDEALAALPIAAANPNDTSASDAANIKPITDPVEAAAWVQRRQETMARLDEEDEADTNVAKGAGLTGTELGWLCAFLVGRQAPPTAMTFEMLDGFLTALVIGPEPVSPSEYLPEVWGTNDGHGPTWDSGEQAQYVFDLLIKHWNSIAALRLADAPHVPFIEHFTLVPTGEAWADGFLTGIDLRHDAWQPIFDDSRADQIVFPILAMTSDAPSEVREEFTLEMRAATVEQLPALLQLIAAYWRSPERSFPRRQPIRSAKVGRNEPCPCGSGKKYKKCCGGSASTLH